MGYTTVRISSSAHRTLKELAVHDARPMQALLDEAVEALRRKRFLERVNEAFANLRKDAAAWSAVEAERQAWDPALLDGLSVHERGPVYRARKAARGGKR
jgi:predicted transcriptional regulator